MSDVQKPEYALLLSDYLRMDSWLATDAICLLCEADPRSSTPEKTNLKPLGKFSWVDEETSEMDVLGKYFSLERIWASGHEWTERHPPTYFMDWAERKHIDVSWLAWARQQPFLIGSSGSINEPSGEDNGTEADELHPRTKNNYLRLIMALAVSFVENFDPRHPHAAAKAIIDATDVSIDERTIASYI
jgi:hypothetical protein